MGLRCCVLAVSATLAACGSDAPTKAGPCDRAELTGCGSSCSTLSVCPSGLYCVEGACQAECTRASAAKDCGSGKLCDDDGRCVDDPDAADSGEDELDGGSGEDGGASGGRDGASGGDGGGGGGGDGDVCGRITLDTTPKTPNVMLIIDQSSSMDEPFGDTDRWTALKNSLLAADGLIAELQGLVRFGTTFYSASNGQEIMPPPPECPVLTEVGIALNNLDAIRAGYPAGMIEDTPTGDSIEAILAKLTGGGLDPPSSADPTIFILATDGEPDTCEELDPQNGQQESIDAVEHAFSLGIKTYVISLAAAGQLSETHLQDLANAGIGTTGATSYRPDDTAGLREALREIIRGVVSCDVRLEGMLASNECPADADVRIGGTKIECNDANGYAIRSATEVTLRGSACDELKAGKQLTASFKCGTATLF